MALVVCVLMVTLMASCFSKNIDGNGDNRLAQKDYRVNTKMKQQQALSLLLDSML